MTPASALRARSATIHWTLVVQAMASAAPAMALVAAGSPVVAARYLFISLAAQLGYYILTRNRLGYVTALVSCIPEAMMLRDHFMFNSMIVLLAGGLALWLVTAYDEFKSAWRSPAFSAFVAIAVLYWWISFLRTGNYTSNLRMLDLALAAASVLLLGRYRSYLSTALVGMALCTVAVGAGLSPYGDRLGMAEIGERSLGNPILIGLPAALALMMAIAHKGHWLLTESRPALRIALSMGVAGVLLLSTSRGSWLVAVVGLGALFVGSRKRGNIVLALAPIVLAGAVALASGRGAFVVR